MAKKKAKKAVRALRGKRAVKVKKGMKVKEKVLGMVDHFFGHISVAAIRVKSPFRVGDVIHVKGHTTDFTQSVDSMQVEHQDVEKAKKGDDIGIKVKDKVRQHDIVYLAAKQTGIAVQPSKPLAEQSSMFPTLQSIPKPEAKGKGTAYGGTKFIKF